VIHRVVESLKDSDPNVRQAALQSLSRLGARGMTSLVNSKHFVAY
jgi:HEAT repeat protein